MSAGLSSEVNWDALRRLGQTQIIKVCRAIRGPVFEVGKLGSRGIIKFDYAWRKELVRRTTRILASQIPALENRSKKLAVSNRLNLASRAACIAGLESDAKRRKRYTDEVLTHLDRAFWLTSDYSLLSSDTGPANGGRYLEHSNEDTDVDSVSVNNDVRLGGQSMV